MAEWKWLEEKAASRRPKRVVRVTAKNPTVKMDKLAVGFNLPFAAASGEVGVMKESTGRSAPYWSVGAGLGGSATPIGLTLGLGHADFDGSIEQAEGKGRVISRNMGPVVQEDIESSGRKGSGSLYGPGASIGEYDLRTYTDAYPEYGDELPKSSDMKQVLPALMLWDVAEAANPYVQKAKAAAMPYIQDGVRVLENAAQNVARTAQPYVEEIRRKIAPPERKFQPYVKKLERMVDPDALNVVRNAGRDVEPYVQEAVRRVAPYIDNAERQIGRYTRDAAGVVEPLLRNILPYFR